MKALFGKVDHEGGNIKVAFSRLRDAPMSNSKLSPARLMFRRALRFPGLPSLPDGLDEVTAGVEKQLRKVADKNRRNSKTSRYGRAVVELKDGLHVLLQSQGTKRFDKKAQVVHVCEGGRSAYVRMRDEGGKEGVFLRNRRFMDYDREMMAEEEVAMAAVEGTVPRGPYGRGMKAGVKVAKYLRSALRGASRTLGGALVKLAKLAAGARRKVTWADDC